MRAFLLYAIELYWLAWPERWRRRCLFQESCSRYVYRTVSERGARAGMRALRERRRHCRPGFSVRVLPSGRYVVELADRTELHQDEVNGEVLMPHLRVMGVLSGVRRRASSTRREVSSAGSSR